MAAMAFYGFYISLGGRPVSERRARGVNSCSARNCGWKGEPVEALSVMRDRRSTGQ